MAARNVTVTKVRPMSAFKIGICMALIGFAAWLIAVSVLYWPSTPLASSRP